MPDSAHASYDMAEENGRLMRDAAHPPVPALEDDEAAAYHTSVTAEVGALRVKSLGAEHVVAGSERVITLLPGETLYLRHFA